MQAEISTASHPSIVDGWFREIQNQFPGDELNSGHSLVIRVKQILHVEKSKYQDVLVFESTHHGRVLVLDGAVQCVERDEFSYQEMIAHLPIASHPNPEKVLIVGGGDGGVLREVLRHPSVKQAIVCDIDEAVPRIAKTYLPFMSSGFSDPRAQLYIGDGFEFLRSRQNEFDVIITDSSDPVGPAQHLFEKPYFQLLKESLRTGGTIASQAESMWLHLPLIDKLMDTSRSLFPVVEYAWTATPSYPSGSIGFVISTLDNKRNLRLSVRSAPGTRYWNQDIHAQAFVLPEFARRVIEKNKSLRNNL